jgi:FkbM family methyltransferase
MGLSNNEIDPVISLLPYLSPDPVIFDVGSNKGEWTDLIIDRAYQVHLFEPNEILLHYTMVKYCDRKNVFYCSHAMCDKSAKEIDFFYFTNENNGLSSILNNPKWDYLPKQRKKVTAGTLSNYCSTFDVTLVDFLKIDTEGADYLVLLGAERLLKEKRIKFIQVEKAEHILLSGYTFDDLTKYLESFGYKPIKTSDTENVIFAMEGFTQDWNSEFKKNTKGLPKVSFALEIGCFEGLTTNYICDNLLLPEGRIICVDPLTDEYLPGHKDNNLFVGQFERFTRNTKGKPVELVRKKSREAFKELENYLFDFIYIDGDHTEEAVYLDGVFAFKHLRPGCFMLFDDYKWHDETQRGIDRFLKTFKGRFEIMVKDYQVLIRKF